RGKQITYALLAERAPNAKRMSRDESLALLFTCYISSHGPATLKDFIWWSGLTSVDAKLALELCRNKFQSEVIDGKEYWFPGNPTIRQSRPSLRLLSVYDEYVIAYADYGPIFIDKTKALSNIFGNAQLNYVIVYDGKIVGTWSRKVSTKKIIIEPKLEIESS